MKNDSTAALPPRSFRVAQAVAVAFALAFVVFAYLSFKGYVRDPYVNAYTIVAFQLVAYAAAAAASAFAATVSLGRRRLAWGLLASSSGIASLGILVLVCFQASLDQAVFTFGLFVAVNGIGLAGLFLLLPERLRHERQAILLIDAFVAAGSLFSILWILVLGRLFEASASTFFDRLTTVLYPSLGVAVLTLGIMVFARTPQEVRAPMRYLLAAWCTAALGLPVYTYLALQGHAWAVYVGPGTVVAALSLQALAALREGRSPKVETPPPLKRSVAAEFFPYVPLFLAIPVVAGEFNARGTVAPVVFAVSMAVVGLVFLRLLLIQRENKRINKGLVESAAFKTEMLRFISHEIANPLTPLVIQQSLMAKAEGVGTPMDEREKRNLEVFSRSLSRLQSLSKDVRSLAQLDAGRLPIERTENDLVAETRKALDAARPTAEQKQLKLNFLAPKASAIANVDAQRYGQVVDNLLSNAIKFTPPGGSIDVAVVPEGLDWVLVVQDTGLGLSPEQRNRLFTAFGRAHGNQAPGLGLGLVICKAIVEGHGGAISVESQGPKRGTQFRVRFPGAGLAARAIRAEPVGD